MLISLSSNAITAKARAIYGKRLRTSDYHELLRQRTVSDIAAFLKANTCYSSTLAGISELQIHRGQLENMLEHHRLELYISLCHYDFSLKRGFYRYAVMDVEIQTILRVIILLNSGALQDIVLSLPTFLKDYFSFDLMRLPTVHNFQDLLEILEGTPYAPALRRLATDNGRINLGECEYALQCLYYRSLFELIDRNYCGKTKQELYEIVQIEVDLVNLELIYRMKTYFHRSPEQIATMLIPYHYKLNRHRIQQLLAEESDSEFIKQMSLSSYSGKMRNVEFNYLEGYTKRLSYIVSRKLMRFSANAPIAFYALMTLSRIEITNITTIIEGIRYQNPSSEIEKLLILE